MLTYFRLLILSICFLSTFHTSFAQSPFKKDFEQFWSIIDNSYAYWHKKQTDWQKVKQLFSPKADSIKNRTEFIQLLEEVIVELYDGHLSLNTNLTSSYQLIPTGTDFWVNFQQGKYKVVDVRNGFLAKSKGIKVGMEIVSIDSIPIDQAVKSVLPKSISKPSQEVYNFCANLVLASTREAKRVIVVKQGAKQMTLALGPPKRENQSFNLLSTKVISEKTAYIKIHNSLGNNNLIPMFDAAVDSFANVKTIILDLRDTPSGGNTTVARAIMGKFISKEMFYQKHVAPYEEKFYDVKRSWMEYVSPKGKIFNKKVVVLVGRWTGSVGEAIALGFSKIKKAKVVGTKMAGLLGAIYCYSLDETQIGFCFPAEQLFHVDGTPREDFIPKYLTNTDQETFELGLKMAK